MMNDSGGLGNNGKGRQMVGVGLFLLFVSAVLYWLGFSMLRPMLALYFNAAGLPLAGVGALMGLHALIPVVLAMPAGQVIDRIGPRKSVMAGALIMLFSGGCYIAGGTLNMLFPMMVGQLFNGTGSLLCWGALQASVAQIARAGEDKKRGVHLLSNFAFINALAQFGGPALGGIFADTGGMVWVFIVFAVLSGIVLLLSPLLPGTIGLKRGNREGDGRGSLKPAGTEGKFSLGMRGSYSNGVRLLRDNRPFGTAMLFNGLLFTLIDIQGTFLPVYLANMGYSPLHVGTLLSAGAVSSIVIRPLSGFFINRFGHRRMMMGCLWAGGLCLGVLVFEPGYAMILGIMFVWGMCSGMNQPMALILVANTVPAESQGMGMSLRTMANRVVQVVNPMAVGGVSAVVGLTNSFGFIALFLVACSFVMNKKLEERPPAGG